MNKLLLSFCFIFYIQSAFSAQESLIKNETESEFTSNQVIEQFKIDQGIAEFTQEKYFSFLSVPIKSSGILKIQHNNVLWQVNTPVFSKLLIINNQIWEQVEITTISGTNTIFQEVATHSSIETLIKTIFTGEVNDTEWATTVKNNQCIVLVPTNSLISQAITQLELCIDETSSQKKITISDKQNNITKIFLTQIATTLTDEDVDEFNIY